MIMRTSRIQIAVLVLVLTAWAWQPVGAEVEHRQINSAYSQTSVRDDPWQPEGFENGVVIPATFVAGAEIEIDGRDAEPDWQRSAEVTVPLQYGSVEEAWIKALYTRDEVFIRVRWADDTENRQHHPWVWDAGSEQYVEGPQVEDSVLISLEAGCEWTPSILGGYSNDFDGWHWLAARSDPLAQALDLNGNIRGRRMNRPDFATYASRVVEDSWLLKFTENHDVDMHADWNQLDRVYLMQPVTTTVDVRAVPDGGLDFVEPQEAPQGEPSDTTAVYPQFIPLKLDGSAGEVSAKGQWVDGYWTVEFKRQLVTPSKNIDDSILNRLTQFSVHVFDRTERFDEAAESPRLFLRFLPEEQMFAEK
jgi:hypothetical protein